MSGSASEFIAKWKRVSGSDLTALLRIAHGNDAADEGQIREDAKRAFYEAILERLVALNTEYVAEEARGLIRRLRPEFQNPDAKSAAIEPQQTSLVAVQEDADEDSYEGTRSAELSLKTQAWLKDPVEQVRAVANVLASSPVGLSLEEIAARFNGRGQWRKRLPPLLEMLEAVGRARQLGESCSKGD